MSPSGQKNPPSSALLRLLKKPVGDALHHHRQRYCSDSAPMHLSRPIPARRWANTSVSLAARLLVIYDDLSKPAIAYRQISLRSAVARPRSVSRRRPSTSLSRLLERAPSSTRRAEAQARSIILPPQVASPARSPALRSSRRKNSRFLGVTARPLISITRRQISLIPLVLRRQFVPRLGRSLVSRVGGVVHATRR